MNNVIELANRLNFSASDISGQRAVKVRGFPENATVNEMIKGLVEKMGLTQRDPAGREYTYQARLDRDGRHLNPSEVVGDVLREDDQIVLHPNIDAGHR